MILVQGAQSALRPRRHPDRLRRWGHKLIKRGRPIAATAMANKLARICWALIPFLQKKIPAETGGITALDE